MAIENEIIRKRYEERLEKERIEKIYAKGLKFYEELNKQYQSKYDMGFESEMDFMEIVSKKSLRFGVKSSRSNDQYVLPINQDKIWRTDSGEVIQLVAIDGVHIRNLFSSEELEILSIGYDEFALETQECSSEEDGIFCHISKKENLFIRTDSLPNDEMYITYLTAKPRDYESDKYIKEVLPEPKINNT